MLFSICLIFHLCSSGIIISSTFLGFSLVFAILLSFDLVTASAIFFSKNSRALRTTYLEAVFRDVFSSPVSKNCFYILLRMIKIHIL